MRQVLRKKENAQRNRVRGVPQEGQGKSNAEILDSLAENKALKQRVCSKTPLLSRLISHLPLLSYELAAQPICHTRYRMEICVKFDG